jgi:hypothetical protein
MNKKIKKLTLNRETLRNLDEPDLSKVVGEAPVTSQEGTYCSVGCTGCTKPCTACTKFCTGCD